MVIIQQPGIMGCYHHSDVRCVGLGIHAATKAEVFSMAEIFKGLDH
jgi:hypothetical protein